MLFHHQFVTRKYFLISKAISIEILLENLNIFITNEIPLETFSNENKNKAAVLNLEPKTFPRAIYTVSLVLN